MVRYNLTYILILLVMIIFNTVPPVVSVIANNESRIRSNIGVENLLSVFEENEEFNVIEATIPGYESTIPDDTTEYREFAIITKDSYLDVLEEHVYNIKYVYRIGDNAVVFAMVSKEQVEELVNKPWILGIAPSPTLNEMISRVGVDKENFVKQNTVRTASSSSSYGLFSSWDIMGIRQTWETYGITGEGVVVGVADTGIDFGYQELGLEAIARDQYGVPITAVVDEHIALTALDTVVVGGRLNTATRWFPLYRTYHSRGAGSPSVVTVRYTVNFVPPAVPSRSGIYKFGALQWFFADYVTRYYIILTIPVVLVDANTPGVYDTVVFDLSTAFYSLCYTMYYSLRDTSWRPPVSAWLDYSFADEPVFNIANAVVARDFDGDGVYDFSLGSIAGVVIDTWGLTDYTYIETLRAFYLGYPGQRPGLASSGKYVALLTDWNSHGTSVASIIGARGRFNYQGYGGSTYKYYGVAYNAKIAGATGFWFGDMIATVYWLAGYDYDPSIDWFVPSVKRSDVVSNSWGYDDLIKWLHQSPGGDVYSLIFDELALMNPFGSIIVFAAGNSGSGYNSVTSPSAGLYIITVGASTNFEYYQIYGYLPGSADNIAMFSSRGPNALGYPKPDVVAVGSYEWAGVRVIEGRGYGVTRYWETPYVGPGLTLFSGTSEATPFVSGVIALGLEALNRAGWSLYHRQMGMKVLLKSSCDDLEYPVLIQGSGRVNAYKLVKTILEGDFVAYISEGLTRAVYENYYNTYGDLLDEYWYIDTAHYTVLKPGDSETIALRLELGYGTVSGDSITYTVSRRITLFSGVYDFTEKLFTIPRSTWSGSDYLEIYVVFKNISYTYYNITPMDYRYMIRVDAFDNISGNLYRLNTEARSSTVALLTIGDLADRVKGDIVVRLRPAYTPPKPVEAEVVAVTYRASRFSWISLSGVPRYINGYGEIPVNINVPRSARPGLYEAKIRVFTPTKTIVIPVTILVPIVVTSSTPLHTILTPVKQPFTYDSQTPLGLVDSWSGSHLARTEALDWRMIPIIVEDTSVAGLVIQGTWTSGIATSLEVIAIPPGGAIDSYGNINRLASYKVTARHGYVYNPSQTEQANNRLTVYIPTRWSMIFGYVRVYYHGTISISAGTINETLSYIYYSKYWFEYYGLYRVLVSYGSYSGSKLYDPLRIVISLVRSSQTVEQIDLNTYRVTAVFTTSPVTGVFMNARVYGLSSESLQNTELTPLVCGYRRYSDGTVVALETFYGLYLGASTSRYTVSVTYTTSYGGWLETVLVLNIPWHASGAFYYEPARGVIIVETYYPAIVSTPIYYAAPLD